jgi:hypothetical protein
MDIQKQKNYILKQFKNKLKYKITETQYDK